MFPAAFSWPSTRSSPGDGVPHAVTHSNPPILHRHTSERFGKGRLPCVPDRRSAETREVDRSIVALAVPAFLALVAEPLFLLADAAIVGHLGTPELAGLGIASVVLRTAVGLCVFLAYGTTAAVARQVGAGQHAAGARPGRRRALARRRHRGGRHGARAAPHRPAGRRASTPTPEVAEAATTYLRLSLARARSRCCSCSPRPACSAASTTPAPRCTSRWRPTSPTSRSTCSSSTGSTSGIAGSAIGTDLAQLGAAVALVAVVVRAARRAGAPLRPDLPGRTALRARRRAAARPHPEPPGGLVVMTWCAAGSGATATATHQLAMTVWTFLAFALDAVAIAAQTITGAALGAGDLDRVRRADRPDDPDRPRLRGGRPGSLLALTRAGARAAVHRRPRGRLAAGQGAARRGALPAGGRGRLRPRRGADRRRRRPLPRGRAGSS